MQYANACRGWVMSTDNTEALRQAIKFPRWNVIFERDTETKETTAKVEIHPEDRPLVEAAPDLLRALKECLDTVAGCCNCLKNTKELKRAIAVITKAEGKS